MVPANTSSFYSNPPAMMAGLRTPCAINRRSPGSSDRAPSPSAIHCAGTRNGPIRKYDGSCGRMKKNFDQACKPELTKFVDGIQKSGELRGKLVASFPEPDG